MKCAIAQYHLHEDEESASLFNEKVIILSEPYRYTKTYQINVRDLTFSTWSYKAMWFEIINSLYHNCNFIYRRMNRTCLTIIRTKEELYRLTSASRRTFMKFYNECLERDYIRVGDIENIGRVFVVNPYYARNGIGLIESVYKLFEDIIDDRCNIITRCKLKLSLDDNV